MLNIFTNINKIIGVDCFNGLPAEDEDTECSPLFHEGAYDAKQIFENSPESIKNTLLKQVGDSRLELVCSLFKDLTLKDIPNAPPADLVHIDCDLYKSTREALIFMMENALIVDDTLIAYDEFTSTKEMYGAGEAKAHYEIVEEYSIKFEELWQSQYTDNKTGSIIQQKLFRVVDYE